MAINWRGVSTVTGGFLLHLTLGTFYTIGNMNTYVTSYIRKKVDPDLTYANGIWLATIFTAALGVTIAFGGWMQTKIGSGWTCFVGSFVFSSFVAVTYVTVKVSFVAVTLTYSLMPGLGCGIAYTVALMNSAKWFPKHKGLVIGLTVGGFGLGALVFNQVQTFYLNPTNKSPDGGDYFTDEDILSKVPSLFLVLAGCYITLQTIGSLMIFEADKRINQPANSTTGILEEVKKEAEETYPYPIERPREVLKMQIFYSMWIMFALGAEAINFLNALYKSFGQTFIQDDHLLATVGSLSSICNCAGRVMWGKLLDKYDSKNTLVLMQGLLSILIFTFYLTSFMGKIAYTIWVCLIFLTFSGVYTLFVGTAARKFGPKHGTTIYCLLFTGPIVSSTAGTPVLQEILKQLGWFKSCMVVGGFPFVGMFLAIFWFE